MARTAFAHMPYDAAEVELLLTALSNNVTDTEPINVLSADEARRLIAYKRAIQSGIVWNEEIPPSLVIRGLEQMLAAKQARA